jgi:hypothetical protein
MQIRTAIVVAFTAGMALVPVSAKALCQQDIYADRAFSPDGTTIQVLGRVDSITDPNAPNAFTFAFFAETTNALFANLIFAAVASHNRLFVIGAAPTCPTTGQFRDMGTILQIVQQP